MEKDQIKIILEAVLMASSTPLPVDTLLNTFTEDQRPPREELQAVLDEMALDCATRSYELKLVSSGYRFQVKKDYADYVSRLWEDKPARYSRALLETLALIAYRQPITRGEIEAVRGVSVSSQIIKTLDERNWIKVVGHRDVPGKPALYATTKEFLDYFNLQSLDELPSLQEIRDIDAINAELDLRMPDDEASSHDQSGAYSDEATETETDKDEMIALNVATDEEPVTDEMAVEADAQASDTPRAVEEAVSRDQDAMADAERDDGQDTSDTPDSEIALQAHAADEADAMQRMTEDGEPEQDETLDTAPVSAEH